MDSKNYIAKNLLMIRKHYSLGQNQIANLSGVSGAAVSSWERGISIPRKIHIEKLIQAMPELTMDDVFSEKAGFSRRVFTAEDNDERIPLVSADQMHTIGEVKILPSIYTKYPKSFAIQVDDDSMNKKKFPQDVTVS